ncbi:GntR family transcriptional regulator [Pseudonocardia hispaniensis]|uniref:GntR family transcriptional regulator n=1 Tax=Pseudonocardia hispaniensis TaxID=904933 RepID=A0ABW1IXD4_9PSEU
MTTTDRPWRLGDEIATVETVVYETIRDRIVRGLEPGTVLALAPIADELGVSTMPVRAALARLKAERLVIQSPRRGSTVAVATRNDLEEIQAVRSGLEGYAARLGVSQIDDEIVERMARVLKRIESKSRKLSTGTHVDAFLSAEYQLHDELFAASGRQELLDLIRVYRRRAERYVRLALRSECQGFATDVDLQKDLFSAAVNRDGARAEHAIRSILQWTIDFCHPLLSE